MQHLAVKKSLAFALLITQCAVLWGAGPCFAYNFLFPYRKWAPGVNTAEEHLGPGSPPMSSGEATWSPMPDGVGLSPLSGILGRHPPGAVTTDIESLLSAAVDGKEYAIIEDAFSLWEEVANINITRVNDGFLGSNTALIGGPDSDDSHLGDIRVGVIPDTTGDIARGYQPCTNGLCGPGGSLGGEILFDLGQLWVDDPNEDGMSLERDFFTVALHEIGHVLGLDRTDVPGSVMWPEYTGANRSLRPDDIAGIQALYGARVPEPSSLILASACFLGMFYGRRLGRNRVAKQ